MIHATSLDAHHYDLYDIVILQSLLQVPCARTSWMLTRPQVSLSDASEHIYCSPCLKKARMSWNL